MCNKNHNNILHFRLEGEDVDPFTKRKEFQRDRDRIIHSRAFRRLMHKTQIFNANKGEHYRNRLTHTLEVMQIARSIGRELGLDEDLIEAIAFGHDLGHTPFGHIGERTLNDILSKGLNRIKPIGEGFKHNYQSVWLVDNIENRWSKYDGLNLTVAVREGMLKHTKLTIGEELVTYDKDKLKLDNLRIDLKDSFTLEGQVVAIADEIAQITHDIDDGMRGEIIKFDDFVACELMKSYLKSKGNPSCESLSDDQKSYLIKDCIGFLIKDVVDASSKKIKEYWGNKGKPGFTTVDDVYEGLCITFSEPIKKQAGALADIKKNWIICSSEISQSDAKAEYMIKQIFKAYYKHPKQLPDDVLARYQHVEEEKLERLKLDDEEMQKDKFFIRLICDHIAGMTDQFAAREYKRLYLPEYC
ncbi:MAG: dNTP triphosphohydrolase [Firmicutes bacterium]|nr:dNTP triphosphohydrolase [Bacillota bacterium]